MVPNSSEKVPNGPQTVHMVPNYLKWSQKFRKGPKWLHIWVYMGIYGHMVIYMGVHGYIFGIYVSVNFDFQ